MILQKKIDKKVKFKILKNKYGSRISLTTAHGTWPPTSDKLDLVHRGFCGNECTTCVNDICTLIIIKVTIILNPCTQMAIRFLKWN